MPKPLTDEISRQQLLSEADSAFEGDRDALAREYCFHTWKQVEVFLCHRDDRKPDLNDAVADFLYHACLAYCRTDSPQHRERARQMLKDDPSLATADIYTASCVGDAAQVARLLDANPDLLDRRGGPFDWEPLMYACYSRLNLPDKSTLDVAKLLLARGANPNAYFMWGGQFRFTAVTGAFGEGECGAENQPPHEQWEALAEALLTAGAHPNDSQSVYNRMFGGDMRCIEMLLEHGLTDKDKTNWIPYDLDQPDGLATAEETLDYLLSWDTRNFHTERAKLCIDHGANIHKTHRDGRSILAHALLTGHRELADYLIEKGARVEDLKPVDTFAAAVMSGEVEQAKAMLADDPTLGEQIHVEHEELLHDAAAAGRIDALKAAVEVGLDIDRCNWRTPLHEAAGAGQLEVVKLLVEAGARIANRDLPYGGSALDWAKYGSRQNIIDYFASRDDLEIFEAIGCNQLQRVRELIESEPALLGLTIRDTRPDPTEPLTWEWKTPLASAITRKHTEMVELLLELGAPTDVGPPDGQSLLEFARENSTEEVVRLLVDAIG